MNEQRPDFFRPVPVHRSVREWQAPEMSLRDKNSFGMPVIPAYSVTGMTTPRVDVRVEFVSVDGGQIAYPLTGDLRNMDPLARKIVRVLLEQSLANLDETDDD